MNRLLCLLAFGFAIAACGDNGDTLEIKLFEASPNAIEVGDSTKLLFVVEPPDATVTITDVGNVSGQVEAMVTPTATTTYQLDAKRGSVEASKTVTVTVGPKKATSLRVEPATAVPTAGNAFAVTITALAESGMTATGYRGTVRVTSTDGGATLPPDVVFTAADAGVKQVMVTLRTAGVATVTGTDVARPATHGTAALTVAAGPATSFRLAALPASATAGQSLVLSITARDAFGNVATGFAGTAQVTSTDPTDILPAPGGFTAGVRIVNVAFTKTGAHFATVSAVGGGVPPVDTTTVNVSAGAPFRMDVTPVNTATMAGAVEPFQVRLVDLYGNTCTGYTGTVQFTSNDPQALLPPAYTFSPADAGVHDFTVTLKTAGIATVTGTDGAVTGAASWMVGAAAATSCAASQSPVSAVAGSVIGLTITMHDAFGNVATSYSGTVRLTSSDARAVLPPDVTYIPLSDLGSHAFSASLLTAGPQSVTATDIADGTIQCSAAIAITAGAPRLLVATPANANAGYSVTVDVAVRDAFDNPVTDFAGTVAFTNTDSGPGATVPAPIVFTGSEGGVGSSSATFVTIGSQTIGASGGGAAIGSASTAVHGLVYAAPTTGRVRLVVNAAQSSTQVVQLDLIANERLERSTFFGGGPASFAVGMNLPLDTTRAIGDAALFTPTTVLPPGTGVAAAAGRIGSDNVLYTVVSRKRTAGTIFTQSTEVQAGQVFYSVRLRLTQTGSVGPIFDGAQPGTLYRAAIRDQWGDDFVNESEFGVGKLEIR